jgi:2,5-diketo-D-gluconate reductase A
MTSQMPTLRLNNGVSIPQLGLGTYQIPEADTKDLVLTALEAGYRHVDTARAYDNERGVGQAVRECGLARNEVFVTTKLWNVAHGYDTALRAFDESMELLGLDVLDLYLIHWPVPAADRYVDTWRAFERLLADGRIRAIGVSNFHAEHLKRLLDETQTVPAVNQIELHPYLQQRELRVLHEEQGIATEAWSPLALAGAMLSDDVLVRLADKHGRTPAQVVLRWHVQVGNVVIPKSVRPERMRENAAIFDFRLEEEDMAAIASLDRNGRIGAHPDDVNE